MQNTLNTFTPTSRQEWRQWLQEHHKSTESIWLIYYKKQSNKPSISYSDAVDEALCFGWIDSKVKSKDQDSYMQFFTKRKPTSVWSKVNKAKVDTLIQTGQMTQAGLDSIQTAKENGSWTILDDVEALILPADLEQAFQSHPQAQEYFLNLSRSDKRNILQWLVMAKRPETRQKRITEIIDQAKKAQKPKQF